MSVRSIQTERALRQVIQSTLRQGIPPSASRAKAEVAARFSRRAAGAPRFTPHLWPRRGRLPIDGYNEDLSNLKEDLEVLFQDAASIRDRSGETERVLIEETAALRSRIAALTSRVERILLDLSPASGFTAWHIEDFTSLDATDSARSKALVDTEHQRAILPATSVDADVATVADVELEIRSDHELTIEAPAEWIFSPYANEAASFLVTGPEDHTTIELNIAMKRPGHLSRIRLDATSGTSYGLRVEFDDGQGSTQVIYDGMVSHPLELPVAEHVASLKFVFGLTEPFSLKGETRSFRLVVTSLQLFREWSSGEADWVSVPIQLPEHALHGRMIWEGEAGNGGRFEGFVELRDGAGTLLTSMPVSSGQIFPIRASGPRSLEFDGNRFQEDSGASTLSLWSASGLFSSGARLIGPKLYAGWEQWKRRIFHNEWADELPPTHVPGPSDWTEYRETVLSDIAYVDHGTSLPAGAMPKSKNVLLSFSTYLSVPKGGQVTFSNISVSSARFSLYVNGNKILDDASFSGGKLGFPVRPGINAIQLYMRTTGETPSIGLGTSTLPTGSVFRAERDPMTMVDLYSVRKASPQHPRLWAAMEAGSLFVRFDPKAGGSTARFRIEYTSPSESGSRYATLIVKLSRDQQGPGIGPSLSRVALYTSPTGSVDV